MIRVSLAFEGVLTEPWTAQELAGLDQPTLQASCLSVLGERARFGARSLASFLGAFAEVEILTVRSAPTVSAIRQWLGTHLPELKNAPVHPTPPAERTRFVAERGIVLHIEHGALSPVSPSEKPPPCVCWRDEPVEHLLNAIAGKLDQHADLTLGTRPVHSLRELYSFSSTPVYLVETADGPFKVRVIEHADQSALLATLHRLASEHPALAELLPEELPGLPAGVHVTPFFPAPKVEEQNPRDGLDLVTRVARWQAALHDLTRRNDSTSLVSCACDPFNLCVADDGTARIIDAADCCFAPRWLDLVWTERLLCPWTGGTARYFETYFQSTPERPSSAEINEALTSYYFRHQTIIRDSLRRRSADEAVCAMLGQVKSWRAAIPTETLLQNYAV